MRQLRILVLLVATALAVVSSTAATPGTDVVAGIPQRGTVLGAKSATVTLIIFEDLGCTHCREFAESALPAIVDQYVRPGLVKIDFRGLGVVTPASAPALRYALAASRQRKLWQVTALFYENQSRLNALVNDRAVRRLVAGLPGLDVRKLLADAKTISVRKQAAAHDNEAIRRNVTGTPWFLVRVGTGEPKVFVPEAYDGESFAAILDQALGR